MPRVKGRGGNGPVKVAQDEDEDQPEDKNNSWIHKVNYKDFIYGDGFPKAPWKIAQGKSSVKVEFSIYSQFYETAKTRRQTSKTIPFKNNDEVLRHWLYLGSYLDKGIEAARAKENEEDATPYMKMLMRKIQQLDDLAVLEMIRESAKAHAELVTNGLMTINQADNEIDKDIADIPEHLRESAKRVAWENYDEDERKRLLARDRQRRHREKIKNQEEQREEEWKEQREKLGE